jgi:hypothetical protein
LASRGTGRGAEHGEERVSVEEHERRDAVSPNAPEGPHLVGLYAQHRDVRAFDGAKQRLRGRCHRGAVLGRHEGPRDGEDGEGGNEGEREASG